MKLESVKESVGSLWNTLSDGWQQLRQTATTALTHFKPGSESSVPARSEVDDIAYWPTRGWAMLGGDVFEDANRLVVKLEVPGMEKQDFDIEIVGDTLIVTGEKKFERESSEGRWQVVQCAYGSFRREIPLTTKVLLDGAKATYTNGVLRIELPKVEPSPPRSRAIPVQ
jgi:HSP20 family protein